MRVVLLNQFYYPDVAATAQLACDLGRHLVASGHRVTAVASAHRYAGPHDAAPPARHDGVDIIRIGGTGFGRGRRLLRALDYGSFATAALPRLASLGDVDVVIALTTPPFIGAVAAVLRPFKKWRVVLWVMDVYPDVAFEVAALRRNGIVGRLLRRMDRALLGSADAVVALDEEMARALASNGAPPARTRVIDNWADDDLAPASIEHNPLRNDLGLGDTFTISYSGNFGHAHDFETVVAAAKLLRDDVHWLFVGDGPRRAWLQAQLEEAGVTRVSFRPYQPRSALSVALGAAHASLVLLRERFAGLVVPSKLYGLLAAGIPIVYVGPRRGRVSQVIERDRVGFAIGNGDPEGLVYALRRLRGEPELRQAMSAAARRAYEARFTRSIALAKFDELLHDLTPPTSRA